MTRRGMCAALALLIVLALTGCQSGIPSTNENVPQATYSPAARAFPSAEMSMSEAVTIYLPNRQGTALLSQPTVIRHEAGVHGAFAAAEAVLTGSALAAENDVELQGEHAVAVSGDICLINLNTAMHKLTAKEQFVLSQALASTLCGLEGIESVCVMICGAAIGLDMGNQFPMGLLSASDGEDLSIAYESRLAQRALGDEQTGKPHTVSAAIYLPVTGGLGVAAAHKSVTAAGQSLPQYARALLGALSVGCDVPALVDLLTDDPVIDELESGGRKAVLRYNAALNERLLEAEIPRSVMMASMTWTLTAFLPGVPNLEVWIGEELVAQVTPQTLLSGADKPIKFDNGLMRAMDFQEFVLSPCTLYLSGDSGGLVSVRRPVPYRAAYDPITLFSFLCGGSAPQDSTQSTGSALPAKATVDMLRGMAWDDGVLHIDLDAAFYKAVRDDGQEAAAIYAIVNTMTSLPGISRVCLYQDGGQPEDALNELYLPGSFSFAPGIHRI